MSKNTIETQGRIFMGDFGSNNKKIIVPNNPIEEAAQSQREAKEVEEAATKAQELAKQKQAEIQRKLQKLEQLPMGTRIIIRPYPNNPYTNLMSEGGILVPSDSMFKNPDTGEWDNHTLGIACAEVIEVGPDCKYVRPGDDVYYDTRTTQPLPFMQMGYLVTHEQGILTFINENLKERLNGK